MSVLLGCMDLDGRIFRAHVIEECHHGNETLFGLLSAAVARIVAMHVLLYVRM